MAGEVENISLFVFRTLLFYLKFLATIFVISWADMKVLFGMPSQLRNIFSFPVFLKNIGTPFYLGTIGILLPKLF